MNTEHLSDDERAKKMKELAHTIADASMDMQDLMRWWTAKPYKHERVVDIALMYAEQFVESALDTIHETQQRNDSMPHQIPVVQAAE